MKGPLLVALALLLAGCTNPTPGADDGLDGGVDGGLDGSADGADGNPGDADGSGGSGSDGDPAPGGSSGSGGTAPSPTPLGNGTANATANATLPAGNGTEPDWGEPAGKGIRPGINMEFDGTGCTTSFVFHQDWTRYFLATAAHCVEDGSSSDTDGCTAPLSDKTKATLRLDAGGTATATVVYSSWDTMQGQGGASADACDGNDFALLEISPDDLDDLHPASLHFEAPTGLADAPTSTVYGYGASSLKGGVEDAHPKQGEHLGTTNGGWSHLVYLVTPAIPGDSGGHVMTSDGKALGVASTLVATPTPGSNHYTDLAMALEYMQDKEGWAPELVPWDGWDPSLT